MMAPTSFMTISLSTLKKSSISLALSPIFPMMTPNETKNPIKPVKEKEKKNNIWCEKKYNRALVNSSTNLGCASLRPLKTAFKLVFFSRHTSIHIWKLSSWVHFRSILTLMIHLQNNPFFWLLYLLSVRFNLFYLPVHVLLFTFSASALPGVWCIMNQQLKVRSIVFSNSALDEIKNELGSIYISDRIRTHSGHIREIQYRHRHIRDSFVTSMIQVLLVIKLWWKEY